MGNLSSCSAATPMTGKSSPLVTRVLLIDGSMLKFRCPIKVINLLLDYPNHVICPLDSLKPGLHSLSSLLPDEKLQLGRLYLLLPFKAQSYMRSAKQQTCSIARQQQRKDPKLLLKEREQTHAVIREIRGERARLLPTDNLNVGFSHRDKLDVGFAKCDRNGGVGTPRNVKLQSSSLAGSAEKKCGFAQKSEKHGFMRKAEIRSSKFVDLSRNGDVGLQYYVGRRSATTSYSKLSERRKARSENAGLFSNKLDDITSPLCDTPELQRAYRSLLRRSSSWTPRLQPIIERR